MSTDKDRSGQGTSSQRLIEAVTNQDSNNSRTNIITEMIAAKSKSQMARCEDLMSRLRTIELAQVQEHVEKQLKRIDYMIDSKPGVTHFGDRKCLQSIDRSLYLTNYDNSLIDCIEQEIFEDYSGDFRHHPLKYAGAMSKARFLYHKRERKAVKATAHVLGEIVANTLPDNTETESESEDETGEEQVLYKVIEKDKVRQYRPVETTPVAKWAKYRSHAISSWSWLNQSETQTEFRIKKSEALYIQLRRAKPMFKLGSPPVILQPRKDVERRASGEVKTENIVPEEQAKPKDDSRGKGTSNTLYEGVLSSSLNLLADVSELSESLKRENIEKVMNTIQHNRSTDQSIQGVQIVPSPPVASPKNNDEDVTQVASRCRPLMPCKPRKVYKMHGINHFMNEVLDTLQLGECPCKPREACIGCLGNKYKWKPDNQYISFKEKLEAFDPCFHKSLSGPEDIPIDIVLNSALNKMAREDIVEGMKILKPFQSVGAEEWLPFPIRSVERETTSANEVEVKKRSRGRPPTRSSDYNNEVARKKKQTKEKSKEIRKFSNAGRLDKRRKEDSDDSDYEDEFGEVEQPSSSAQAAFRRLSRLRAGRKKMDYDITNIVIPSHYSSNTRVEKLSYKEIIIPSFRIINVEPNMSEESLEQPKKIGIKREKRFKAKCSDDQFEDLEEDTIEARHERCLQEERRKFNSFLHKQSNRRRRKSNNDSVDAGNGERTSESLDVNEGMSPSMPSSSHSFLNDEKQAQVISSEDASAAAAALKVVSNRRRTISASKMDEEDYEEFTIAPYPVRQFPLSKELFEELQNEMPDCFFNSD